ncbi:MAG TPA: class I SAM-dependent methyltransferase, partial [Anaerolineaceae bacterium]|nr:class I SAM-dependent methyltransferase [Anaerolineaceae bacterium]
MAYTEQYENSLHFSPRFQDYAHSLAASLIDRYDLREKDVVEIGSGQGDFLALLCALGGNRGTGFDPSYTGPAQAAGLPLRFVKDFYSERYADTAADLIVSRHTLEHIDRPRELVAMLRRSLDGRPAVVFFEVPNALFTLRGLSIWDLIYEHVSYFTPSSLARLFSEGGFEVLRVAEAFDGQFLTVEATPRQPGAPDRVPQSEVELAALHRDVQNFVSSFRRKMGEWTDLLAEIRTSGKRAVVWGAGSKGVTFMNLLGAGAEIERIVDINPRKHGMYVAGSGQQIVPPEEMKTYCPEWIVLMNPIYRGEVEAAARDLGLDAQFLQA